MNGSVILQQEATGKNTTINVSNLPSGVYMIKTVNGYNTAMFKFTKL